MGCSGSKADTTSSVTENPASPYKSAAKPSVLSDEQVKAIMAAPRPKVFLDVSIGERARLLGRTRVGFLNGNGKRECASSATAVSACRHCLGANVERKLKMLHALPCNEGKSHEAGQKHHKHRRKTQRKARRSAFDRTAPPKAGSHP